MPKAEGPGYNAQLAVDEAHNFILANDVTDEANDQNQFSNMHQKTEDNLPLDNNRGYTTDSGYHSLKQLEYIAVNNINAVIADPTPQNRSTNKEPSRIETIIEQEKKLERKDFTYHKEADYYECPAGDKLVASAKSGKFIIYRASSCSTCPIAKFCLSGKSKIKQVYRDQREGLAEAMYQKLQTDEAKHRIKTRAMTVEPVFGNIKQNLGFRRFSLRGLKNVKGEFNLICIVHNLNILFKLMQPKCLSAVIATSNAVINQHIVISKIFVAIFIHRLIKFIKYPFRLKYGLMQA
jgi:transposase